LGYRQKKKRKAPKKLRCVKKAFEQQAVIAEVEALNQQEQQSAFS